MADPNEVKIHVKTTSDVQGVENTSTAIKGLASKAKPAVEGLNRTFEGLSQAMQGGASMARGLGNAIGGIFAAAGKFAWVGLLIQGIGLVISIIGRMKDAFADSAKVGEESAKKASDAWVAGMDRAASAGDQKLVEYFKEIARAANEATKEIDAVTNAIIAQTDADEAVALAQIDANEALSDSEKLQSKASVRANFRAGRAQTKINAMADQERVQADLASQAQAGVGIADGELSRRQKALSYVDALDPEKLKAEKALINKQLAQNIGNPNQADRMSKQAELMAKLNELDANIASGGPDGSAFAARRAQAAAAVAAGEKAKQAAEEKANEEARALEILKRNNARDLTVLTKTTAAQQTVDNLTTGAQIKTTRANEQEQARKDGILAQIGSDSANKATAFGSKLAGTQAAKDDSKIKDAADAVLAAAQAARQGGATESESQALLAALIEVRTVLASNGRTSATLMREIETLRSQVAALRTK